MLISPSGKWKVTTVNNEETDFISSRKKLDFDHTPFTANDLKKDTLYSSTPSLKKCNGHYFFIYMFFILYT